MRTLGFKTADNTGFVLDLLHGGLSPDDDVPDTLAGNAGVFGDLSKGEVFIIIEIEELLLPLGQELTIKIEEHRHAIGLIFHGNAPFCKALRLSVKL